MTPIAQWVEVGKRYGPLVAVEDVSLALRPGEVTALVGHNGAGKTTLIKLLLGLIRPSVGRVEVQGQNPAGRGGAQARRTLGFLPENVAFHGAMTAVELMAFYARLKGCAPAGNADLLARVGLAAAARRRVATYSKGMRQRLGIAQALIGDPKLIIVDEPTAGLDPGERNRFYNLLSEIGENVIVILSTHIVEDVKELCSNMAIINGGRVLYAGSPEAALLQLEGKIWEKSITKAQIDDYQSRFRVISSKLVAGKPIIHILSDGDPGDGFRRAEAGLEDVFFAKIDAGA